MNKNEKHVQIRYIARYEEEEGIKIPKWITKKVVASKTIRFNNCIHLLAKLSHLERLLLDYLVEQMDSDNFIANNSQIRNGFISLMSSSAQITYKEKSINNAFLNLKKTGLLLSYSKGEYYVNPMYFFNGNTDNRKAQIVNHLREKVPQANVNKTLGTRT